MAESFQRKTCKSPWHDPPDGLFAKPSEPDHFPYDLTGDRNVPLWLIQSLSKAAIVSVKKKEETGEHGGAAIQSNDLQRARVPNWKIVKDFYAGA